MSECTLCIREFQGPMDGQAHQNFMFILICISHVKCCSHL